METQGAARGARRDVIMRRRRERAARGPRDPRYSAGKATPKSRSTSSIEVDVRHDGELMEFFAAGGRRSGTTLADGKAAAVLSGFFIRQYADASRPRRST